MSTAIAAVELGENVIGWREVVRIAREGAPIAISQERWERITRSRAAVDAFAHGNTPYYGINTGLGALYNVRLEFHQLRRLSWHTLMSHACCVGQQLRDEQVRAIMVAAVVNYSHGYSGISVEIVERLVDFLNAGITPVVPRQGSVGYLAHMAHIGLTLVGHGDVRYQGETMPAGDALTRLNKSAVELGAKDGLSLVNGTPAMTGLACLALDDANRLSAWADIAAAMSFEALGGQLAAFGAEVLALKPHPGVQVCGRTLRELLHGSAWLAERQGTHLQDALSLRSIPQVHGACRDQLSDACRRIDIELASATDNPLVIESADGYQVISQANPHGASVALACDQLAMAVAEWGALSERRIYRLVTPEARRPGSSLPPFLSTNSGMKSGMMIAQYTAASLAADNKRLSQPVVTDNFLTSALQEDHVSLGESAALKLDTALENAFRIVAIEWLCAAQAFDLLTHTSFAVATSAAWRWLRDIVAAYDEERPLSGDIEAIYRRLRSSPMPEAVTIELSGPLLKRPLQAPYSGENYDP
ncbi:HAL/PAL/TAL family ammonia-lyase [Kushneria aurantia]|uniref:Histidine ammonia-lyase n=1 Tax=Kushneria aurantia TaxID=504092 RepID=A0ABV6G621_9GAMM|nr:histidine ammonia-lyase [Kushneria aurantia]